jgi:hypothetical protein
MKKFSIIHVPILSFFSGELYRDVGLNWRGICFGYLFLLVAVCTIPRMFLLQKSISLFIDEEAPPLIEQVPKIMITNGQVHVDELQPYYIKATDSNDVLVIIDTTGEIQSLDDTDAFILLTKTKLIYCQSDVEYRTYDLSGVKEFVLDKVRLMGWLNIVKKLIVPVLLPFILLGSYIFRMIQALIYAVIGLIFAAFCRVKLSYDTLVRLAVVAITPCIIVRTIFEIASVHLPMAGLWFFLLAMGYLFVGVRANFQPVELSSEDNIFPDGEKPL